jgi:hypothetical protein
MADRCEHGARLGQCSEHPTKADMVDTLQSCLDNLSAFNTKKMDGVDVIFLGHVEDGIKRVIAGLEQ